MIESVLMGLLLCGGISSCCNMAYIVSLVRTKATASSSRAASRGKAKAENEAVKEVKAEEEQSGGFAFSFKNLVATCCSVFTMGSYCLNC